MGKFSRVHIPSCHSRISRFSRMHIPVFHACIPSCFHACMSYVHACIFLSVLHSCIFAPHFTRIVSRVSTHALARLTQPPENNGNTTKANISLQYESIQEQKQKRNHRKRISTLFSFCCKAGATHVWSAKSGLLSNIAKHHITITHHMLSFVLLTCPRCSEVPRFAPQ